ncbi:PREDICTED: uncharacterized protein LOC106818818 [Priapulus caudatus]|uniref:Uncharacterized protein LOC106818818 n=1 Tax=Priapulus caudatus TaxID=37621 RepID=A0ABM1F3F6_PRICU|nr:PREDICTED: uncharacterized protein LOC106818818 [Priapulus caudatus]
METYVTLAIVLLFLHTLIEGGESIQCYDCNSVTDPACTENYDHGRDALEPMDCGGLNGATYCIKTIGIYGGQIGTRRFCSSRDMGSYCQYVKFVDDDRRHRACIYTCARDDCNGATYLRLSSLVVVTAFAAALRSTFC